MLAYCCSPKLSDIRNGVHFEFMLVYIKERMVKPNPQEIVLHTVTVGHITVEPMPKLYCQNEAISYGILFLIFLFVL